VNVATANPVKVRAVTRAFRRFFRNARIRKISPPKGPDLPRGKARTFAWARRRARLAFKNCAYSVGIESGLDGANLITVCVIYDGKRFAEGMGPTFRLPWRVPPGGNLEKMFGRPGLGRDVGAIGILSQGRVDRAHVTEDAVLMALSTVASIWGGC
jgi:inosine/xanthosine triphosphatase